MLPRGSLKWWRGAHLGLAKGPAHPFYQRVNELLEEERFDAFAEKECANFLRRKQRAALAGAGNLFPFVAGRQF
jgi:hypothetical protein